MKRLIVVLIVGFVTQLLLYAPLVHAQAAHDTGCWSATKPLVIHVNDDLTHQLTHSCKLLRFVPEHGQIVVVTGYFSVAVLIHGKTHWLRSDRKGHNLLFSTKSVTIGVSAPRGKGITYRLYDVAPMFITKEIAYVTRYLVQRDHARYLVTEVYSNGWEQNYV
jgi:hypothetical protein